MNITFANIVSEGCTISKGQSGNKLEKSADSVPKHPIIGQFEAYGYGYFYFFFKSMYPDIYKTHLKKKILKNSFSYSSIQSKVTLTIFFYI